MQRAYNRQTVSGPVRIEGPGLHSGAPTAVIIEPGDMGIRFREPGGEWVAAIPANVTDTSRCTRLGAISTIEHLMAAFAGLEVTDVDVVVEGGELPAAGGCATPFVEAVRSAGLTSCGTLEIEGPFARIFLQELPTKFAVGLGEGWWRSIYVREGEFIGRQEFEIELNPESFANEVAPARTFVLESEIEIAKHHGLGQGLDAESCLAVGSLGYLNPARFQDEPARHKLLDCIGDMYLAGVPVAHLDVVAEYSGHKWNVEAARKLAAAVRINRT